MSLGLISELDAVNKILASSGDSPVITLEGSYLQANLARTELKEAHQSLQGVGWYFNEEEKVELTPDINNKEIVLPSNCIEAVANFETFNADSIIQRGNKLYNRTTRTYEFTKNLFVDMLLVLEWNLLPQVAREVAILQASMSFISNFVGDNNLYQIVAAKLDSAMSNLESADAESRKINMLTNTTSGNIAFNNRR